MKKHDIIKQIVLRLTCRGLGHRLMLTITPRRWAVEYMSYVQKNSPLHASFGTRATYLSSSSMLVAFRVFLQLM